MTSSDLQYRVRYVEVADGCSLTWEEIAKRAQLSDDAVCVRKERVWNQQCEVYIVASADFAEIRDFDVIQQHAAIGRHGEVYGW